jgi:hypothetical protein
MTSTHEFAEPNEPAAASAADQAAAALDIAEDLVTTLEQVLVRLDGLENTTPSREAHRGVFRVELQPPAETEHALTAQADRIQRTWYDLADWVTWLVATYRLTSAVPPCWPLHATVAEELVGLHVAWLSAWTDDAAAEAVLSWHERLARARERLMDGNWGSPRCTGDHDTTDDDRAGLVSAWLAHFSREPALLVAVDDAIGRATRRAQLEAGDRP